jgi:hypothetical protein
MVGQVQIAPADRKWSRGMRSATGHLPRRASTSRSGTGWLSAAELFGASEYDAMLDALIGDFVNELAFHLAPLLGAVALAVDAVAETAQPQPAEEPDVPRHPGGGPPDPTQHPDGRPGPISSAASAPAVPSTGKSA